MGKNRQITIDQDIYRRLCRARSFIDRNFYQPINLEQIASQACFSRYHFIRLFRQAFNKTPHRYLTQKRVERAKELLTSSKVSVTDVCFEVGFESLGSFSSLFRKYVGHSPAGYRTRTCEPRQIPENIRHIPIPFCLLVKSGLAETGDRQL